jgi:hypothetical protein
MPGASSGKALAEFLDRQISGNYGRVTPHHRPDQ